MDYPHADLHLKHQLIRQQCELILYIRIRKGVWPLEKISEIEKIWLENCALDTIQPFNNFSESFAEFQRETLLKFAPDSSLDAMEKKALLECRKLNFYYFDQIEFQ